MVGLTTTEVDERIRRYGLNRLPKPKPVPAYLLFLHQFKSPLIYILLAAAIVSLFLHEMTDAIFIFAVLMINALIGTFQEFSAQKSANALQDMVSSYARVIRDGKEQHINAEQLVPGDRVLLASGDKVPADIALVKSENLQVDESLLTGESIAVAKDSHAESTEDMPLSEQTNRVFAGTMVAMGRGQGDVTATALYTVIGQIAKEVTGNLIVKPPLLQRIERFTLFLMYAVLSVVSAMFVVAFFTHQDLVQMFMIAVALAVSAIPEGLPVAITVALSIGMGRMAKRHVIVRKLLAVESLGSCTFIASDKTGTLTINELTAKHVLLPDGAAYAITGEGVSVDGHIEPADGENVRRLETLCHTAVLTNEALLHQKDNSWVGEGDMVDVALLVMGQKYGIQRHSLLEKYPEMHRMPYESENGFSASLHAYKDDKAAVFVKGSPEAMIARCSHMQTRDGVVPIDKDNMEVMMASMASAGYRVLAFAYKSMSDGACKEISDGTLEGLVLLGLVGMIDPLRAEVKDSVAQCKAAGIDVAMITGDHPLTARAIAQELGLDGNDMKVVAGKDVKAALEEGKQELDALVAGCRVFARIEPTQKKDIVEAISRRGHFVAVTGDGVNDAPALKQAHVGVAMGKRGTDVARENADLILTDDNFSSIVHGIQEGRVVYNNIRKVIFLLVSTGAAELVLFLLSMMAGLPMPLLAVQLLWLNLVTNGIQDVALSFEPAEGDELRRPPRHPKEPIFNVLMVERVLLSAVFMGGLAFAVFYWLLQHGYPETEARNYILLLMVLLENVQAFNSRSEKRSVFRINFFGNPLLLGGIVIAQMIHIVAMYLPGISNVLDIQPVSFAEWGILLLFSCTLLSLDEIFRLVRGKKEREVNIRYKTII